MFKNTKKAFTLVELIVVIVILAILATIAFITLQDYPKDARDTERKTEVAGIYEKISILNAKDPNNTYESMMSGTVTPDTSISPYKIYKGTVDLTKIGEGNGFKDPDGSDYKYLYVTESGSTEVERCFIVGARSEKTGNYDITKGECNISALSGSLSF